MIARILTIAGSDSSGGAGIQADLKTITVLGAYGMSTVTAITVQNTLGVEAVHPVPPELVARQIDLVAEDLGVDAAKTGMLVNGGIVEVVADRLARHEIPNLVVDPVIAATGGRALLARDAVRVLKEKLLPLARVVTPNLPEAEILAGMVIAGEEDLREAARRIRALGPPYVVIKGGHREGPPTDLLFDGNEMVPFEGVRYSTPNTHGTGCTFSAALAAALGQGDPVPRAVARAKQYLDLAIRHALDLGRGHGPTNHFAPILMERARGEVLEALENALVRLEAPGMGELVPAVPSSLVYALPKARTPEEVAGFPGGIVRFYDSMAVAAPPDFGVSEEMGRIVLSVMERFPQCRAAMNIRYVPETADRCLYPEREMRILRVEKRSAGTHPLSGLALDPVLAEVRQPPDLIRVEGGEAWEPHLVVLGRSPDEVVRRVVQLAGFPEAMNSPGTGGKAGSPVRSPGKENLAPARSGKKDRGEGVR